MVETVQGKEDTLNLADTVIGYFNCYTTNDVFQKYRVILNDIANSSIERLLKMKTSIHNFRASNEALKGGL